ncbi:hypothetical protein LCGC14_3082640, partial [marine sediment metagenome]
TEYLEECLDYGLSDLQSLHTEMTEWQESLESADMEHMPKYDEVTEAVDVLEHVEDVESAVEQLKEALTDKEEGDPEIAYLETSPYGRKPAPRWMQHTTALSQLQAVVDHLENHEKDEVIEARDALASAIADIETVDFPGMY